MLALGVTILSGHHLQAHEGRWLKLESGAVMLGLGWLLVSHPNWPQWTRKLLALGPLRADHAVNSSAA